MSRQATNLTTPSLGDAVGVRQASATTANVGSVTLGPAALPDNEDAAPRPARLACLAAAGEYPWGRPDCSDCDYP